MKPTFQILVVIVAAIGLTAGAAFAGGVLYGRESSPESGPAQTQAAATGAGGATGSGGVTRPAGTGAGQGGAAATIGVIDQVNGQTITLKKQDGSSVSVSLQPDTQVTRSAPAATTDLQPGMTVTVAGQTGTDGTVTARSVQIGGRVGAGGAQPGDGAAGASPAASPSP